MGGRAASTGTARANPWVTRGECGQSDARRSCDGAHECDLLTAAGGGILLEQPEGDFRIDDNQKFNETTNVQYVFGTADACRIRRDMSNRICVKKVSAPS